MAERGVDLGFFNGDVPAWDLEKDFEDFELQSRFFPSKVTLVIYLFIYGDLLRSGNLTPHRAIINVRISGVYISLRYEFSPPPLFPK